MLKKFVADSYYEACLKAQSELGEDMMVVTSRVFQKKTWGGLYSREMVEITAAVPGSSSPQSEKGAPARPAPTEEITGHSHLQERMKPRMGTPPLPRSVPGMRTGVTPATPSHSQIPSSKVFAPAQPIAPPKAIEGPATYPATRPTQPKDNPLRAGHGLRSNQERNSDPHPQKCADDAQNTAKIQDLLGKILQEKNKELLPARQPAPLPQAGSQSHDEYPISPRGTSTSQTSLKDLEKQLMNLATLIKQMQTDSSQALSAPCPSLPEGIADFRERLIQMEMPAEIIDDMIEGLRDDLSPAAQKTFANMKKEVGSWLKRRVKFCPEPALNKTAQPTIMILMGPTGVGKTTTIAKLAAAFALNIMDRKSVTLFTLDTFRIGASSQLSQYAQIIEADMEIIMEPGDILPAIERHQNKDLILVDTAGRGQKDKHELEELKSLLDHFPNSSRYLALSATTKYTDMLENVRRFGEVGYDNLIFTKIDETNSLGPLLAILYKIGSPLGYLTHGQSVPNDFRKANLEFFLSQLFPEE